MTTTARPELPEPELGYIETDKSRAFDVRCYRIRSQWSGGNSPDERRVTPQPAPHKRPPAAHQPAKEQ